MNNDIRVRFAPSPTGFLHIGGLRTALYNYLFAQKNKGKFILRVEDTDQKRYVPGAIENLLHTLKRVNIAYEEGLFIENNNIIQQGDFGPYKQSERFNLYQKYAQKLIEQEKAYYCFCTEQELETEKNLAIANKIPYKYSQKCRNLTAKQVQEKLDQKLPFVIRLKVPLNQNIEFSDMIRGKISFNTNEIDDQILIKSDGFPTYHLANVVDDHLMAISHVIRGEEWLPSTPKHILLYQAFGWQIPEFAHLALLLNKDKSKLSKRQGDVAVEDYLKKGFLPQALLNFVLLLGWNPGNDQEILSMNQMIELFDLSKAHKSGAVFDLEKLEWMNGLYIRQTETKDLADLIIPFLIEAKLAQKKGNELFVQDKKIEKKYLYNIIGLEKQRIKTLSEITDLVDYLFKKNIEYNADDLIWKKSDTQSTKQNLSNLLEFLKTLDNFDKKNLETNIKDFIEKNNLTVGEVLWPLRVALTGKRNSPGPFEVAEALSLSPWGKELIFERVQKAIEKLV